MTDADDLPDDELEARHMRILDAHAAGLMEHFDSVQIIATKRLGGSTVNAASGGGNFYARYGSVREWLIRQDEMVRENVREEGA